MASWTDRYWNSAEGLRLHYRDYAGPADKPPILCIPGLSRNARDFEPVADRYAGDWRVICVDLRGRGGSEYDLDTSRYAPTYYVADVLKLLDQLGIADAVFVGTSLGGICTMLLAATDSDRIAGAVLNDVGPVIGSVGIDRIGSYIGLETLFASWDEAIETLAARNHDIYPDWTMDQWAVFARRICADAPDGGVRFDYDMGIADNFRLAAGQPPVDAWPLFRALAGRPVTILRGELSDLLTADTAEKMVEALDDIELVTVDRVGHAPALDEAESLEAIDRLLDRVSARQSDPDA